jgi:AcrR family transcriptional regulator
MAIIVDKEQKRRDIALSCKNLVLANGIHSLSVARLAKEAGIGKGTIYEYFKNKEEILFEIVTILMQKHSSKLLEELQSIQSTKEKIKKFSEFFYTEEDYELRKFYKEFTSLSLGNPTPEVLAFQTVSVEKYYNLFENILQAGVEKGELKEASLALSRGIFVVGKGMYVIHETTTSIKDLKMELNKFFDALFALMEV